MAVRYWNITHQNSSPDFLDLFDHSVIIHLKFSIRHQHKRGQPFNNTYRVLWRGDTGFVLRLTQNCSQPQVAIGGTADFPLPPCFLIFFQPGRLLIKLPGSHFISHFFLIPRYKTLIHTVEMYISLPLSLRHTVSFSLSHFPPLFLSLSLVFKVWGKRSWGGSISPCTSCKTSCNSPPPPPPSQHSALLTFDR